MHPSLLVRGTQMPLSWHLLNYEGGPPDVTPTPSVNVCVVLALSGPTTLPYYNNNTGTDSGVQQYREERTDG
jgi:hypothetical protein